MGNIVFDVKQVPLALPPKKKELRPALNLRGIFEECHNFIYANEGLRKEQVFNEVLKLIFVKIVDEQSASNVSEFYVTPEERNRINSGEEDGHIKRIIAIFEKAKGNFKDVFSKHDQLNLRPSTVAYVVNQLQGLSLTATPFDVKGLAFQTFVYEHERGERGEFFTPLPVIQLCVGILRPKHFEMTVDPACGSAGFLVEAIKLQETAQKRNTYAMGKIRGIDFNPDLARVSKMHVMLYGGPSDCIITANSLESFETINERSQLRGHKIVAGSFDVVMTNPPFGTRGKVTERRILEQFDLGKRWKWIETRNEWVCSEELSKGQIPEILFLERCLQFLRDGGRMAIVLPDGELNNFSTGYVRQYLLENARLVGVVSLPSETFIPYGTSAKASVLFLQKLKAHRLSSLKEADYPLLMATCERIGYDMRGRVTVKRPGNAERRDNADTGMGRDFAVDTDIPRIVQTFREFIDTEKLGF